LADGDGVGNSWRRAVAPGIRGSWEADHFLLAAEATSLERGIDVGGKI
jgi:hypothetical protein